MTSILISNPLFYQKSFLNLSKSMKLSSQSNYLDFFYWLNLNYFILCVTKLLIYFYDHHSIIILIFFIYIMDYFYDFHYNNQQQDYFSNLKKYFLIICHQDQLHQFHPMYHIMLLNLIFLIFLLIIIINEKMKPLFQDLVFLNLNTQESYIKSIYI